MIVVTTPTGNIGRLIAQNLLTSGAPVRVIARDPTCLTTELRDNCEVVPGSHGDAAVVNEAFKGAEAVFWLAPPDPKAASVMAAYVDFTRPAAMAIKERGVKRVVSITALGRSTPYALRAGYVTGSLAMDDMFLGTGVAFRGLACPSFMDNILRQVAAIRDQGKFYSPISGDLKLPSVATQDIAAVATRWLLDNKWTGHGEVPVLGPEDISFNDMAEIISDVLGARVSYQQISLEAYKARLLRFGMSDAMAQGMTDMAWAKDRGLDLGASRTAETGTPTSFRNWCEEKLVPAVLGQTESKAERQQG
ncbi:NmrA family NAD(P)-binding protein [Pelagibius sp. 7325]|uniref:NmrA family NAD(P)-binding protein n=1 Tax=Pelagibius sp. 7325 TaxID=3131994 RepID=UPI0030EE0A1E